MAVFYLQDFAVTVEEDDGHDDLLGVDNGERHREVHEGVECDRNLAAVGALDTRLVLALEVVDDDRVVAFLVVVPGLVGDLKCRISIKTKWDKKKGKNLQQHLGASPPQPARQWAS